jgi:hypothetical protein
MIRKAVQRGGNGALENHGGHMWRISHQEISKDEIGEKLTHRKISFGEYEWGYILQNRLQHSKKKVRNAKWAITIV